MSESKRQVPVDHTEERTIVTCDGEGCDAEAIINYLHDSARAAGWWRIFRRGSHEGTYDVVVDACSDKCFLAMRLPTVPKRSAVPA